ncbi:MAG: dipeptidase PepE [Acidobacteria bacterium]|nr:dipeptidase PepE [Acidobacteriota bacterium]MBV9067472.1 dipeptidase PepE [Acidobacteriota bacterium]MBV9186958.1 dipeptidase PepE [Acidobacteriota bacterium]
MRLLLISSSNVHGYVYLDHPESAMRAFLGGARRVAFVPFAAHDHDAYMTKVRERLARMDLDVIGIDDLDRADAIFVGGGNTFRLLKTLYDRNLLTTIRDRVRAGLPYLGSSAGTVIAAPTMQTTNDMPIVEPPSFAALGLVDLQINPHYLDPDPHSTHRGETREERIREYLEENDGPVIGLREGSILQVENNVITLLGEKTARLFQRGAEPVEVQPGVISVPSASSAD